MLIIASQNISKEIRMNDNNNFIRSLLAETGLSKEFIKRILILQEENKDVSFLISHVCFLYGVTEGLRIEIKALKEKLNAK